MESGGCSPNRLNGLTSTQLLKSSPENLQNNGNPYTSQIKGKKRCRVDQSIDPIKQERMSTADYDDSTVCKFFKLKTEISKIVEKGALISIDGVEKLVQFMHIDTNKQIDLAVRVLLSDVIAATDRIDCLHKFVQIRGVPVLDEWLQEAHKGKAGDGSSPKESDKDVEELLLSLLRALDKLPVNLNALQTCNIGKSVNHLRSHKNLHIQKKARSLVDTWKKRVDAEIKTNEAKPVGSNQAVFFPVTSHFSEASHQKSASADFSIKSSTIQQSTTHADDIVKSPLLMGGSAKLQSFPLAPAAISSKGSFPKETDGNESLDPVQMVTKEEMSSSSSQSHDNIQSYFSDNAKTIEFSLNEGARSSTARSMNARKTSGNSSRHQKFSNGFMLSNISAVKKETNTSKSASVNKSLVTDKDSFSVVKYDRIVDMPSDNGNSHRFIIKLTNSGLSPARCTTVGSLKDPSASSGASSPSMHEKYEHGDLREKSRNEADRTHSTADVKAESWLSNDGKEVLAVSSEVIASPTILPVDDHITAYKTGRAVERATCSSSGSFPVNDNTCCGTDETKPIFCAYDTGGQNIDPLDKKAAFDSQKDEKERDPVVLKDEIQEGGPTIIDDGKTPLLEDFNEDFSRDVHQNKNKQSGKASDGFNRDKLDARSSIDENKEKVVEESTSASNSDRNFLSHSVGNGSYGKQFSSVKIQGDTEQKTPSIAEIETYLERGDAVTLSTADRNVSAKEHTRFSASHQDIANIAGTMERKGSLECCVAASVGNAELPQKPIEGDASIKKEELESMLLATSFITTVEQGAGAKLDFDLNEGIPGDDWNQSGLIATDALICSTEIRIPSLSLFSSSPISSGLLSPITIAALAKGSFLSMENFLNIKGESGWKGPATTSAFRPAEPRKFLYIPPNASNVQLSESAMTKQGRHLLNFDLNVPDERALEEAASQKIESESVVNCNLDASSRVIAGLDFDLNIFDVGSDNRQCSTSSIRKFKILQFPDRPASEVVSHREVDILRNIDPNIRAVIDVVDAESVPRSQMPKSPSSLPFVPSVTGFTMNNSELGSGWFPAGNSYPAVAIPSFLPDRGEASYPIVAATGGHRILGSGAGTFRSDIYRGPLLSSSPALAFSPPVSAFSYAGFPFSSGFPLTSSFSARSKNFVDSASVGSYVPPVASQLAGQAVSPSFPYLRPYALRLSDDKANGVSDGNRKWGNQVLDLNAGSGCVEEVKDRLPLLSSSQIPSTIMQTFMEEQEQERLYQVRDGSLKRKEPEGSWEAGKFIYRQPSWN